MARYSTAKLMVKAKRLSKVVLTSKGISRTISTMARANIPGIVEKSTKEKFLKAALMAMEY